MVGNPFISHRCMQWGHLERKGMINYGQNILILGERKTDCLWFELTGDSWHTSEIIHPRYRG